MTNPIAATYRGYLACFAAFGHLFSGPYHGTCDVLARLRALLGRAAVAAPAGVTFSDIDSAATRAGEVYRGVGVAVGVSGIAILFCALAPLMFALSHHAAQIIGVIKVALMLLALALLLYGIHSQLRSRWITLRRQAERLRYRRLRHSIEALALLDQAAPEGDGAAADLPRLEARRTLQTELDGVLHGGSSQIAYNTHKAAQYLHIEEFADSLGWMGFSLALAAAVAHLVWHHPILIFFTAFVPTLVGGIHGINQFLRIRELAEHHGKMADRLRMVADELALPTAVDDERLVVLARQAVQALQDHDAHWEEEVARHALKAG
ncbi:MAG: hypothetical protein COZ47_03960 [Lysobacterales bacterium CG_4_10_14_3_um_filter_64_11]|nr:MAG: hypothetical protein COZ47_03960 [Xanthomonadales bacterium CG_4_10_14_3_um_filter_64_11]